MANNNERNHKLVYWYPRDAGNAAYPKNAATICKQLSSGLVAHRVTSIFLILSLLGLLGFILAPWAGLIGVMIVVIMSIVKIGILQSRVVQLSYSMDRNWKNLANTRMAPFTYMMKCQRIWEVVHSQGGYDRKYNAGCNVQVSRKDVRVIDSLPFPFKANVKAYGIDLGDYKFFFLPDCVYMVGGTEFKALHYEDIRWQIGTTLFFESNVPSDAQVVGRTWQYVNKKGGPDRRFSYNPEFAECRYGELIVNFAGLRRATFQLSSIKMVEGIMRL